MSATFDELSQIMRTAQESRTLLTAVELDVFTTVGAGETAAGVATRLSLNPRATEMLLNALVALGALEKKDGVFHNTSETARYLVAGSPGDSRQALMHVVNGWRLWSTLTDAVRTGNSVMPTVVEAQEPDRLRAFIAMMHKLGAVNVGPFIAAVGAQGVNRLLDLGGGSGAYSIAFAQANDSLRAVVFDIPAVTEIASEHIAEAGLADRISTLGGDLLSGEFPAGNDLVLLSAIAHMFSETENQNLFRACFQALVPGGRLAVREFILDPDKTTPRRAAMFSLNMLVSTRAGASYSEDEYRQWLLGAGFHTVTRPVPDGDILIATR
jgi:predicted O-methyltransferase YrrM